MHNEVAAHRISRAACDIGRNHIEICDVASEEASSCLSITNVSRHVSAGILDTFRDVDEDNKATKIRITVYVQCRLVIEEAPSCAATQPRASVSVCRHASIRAKPNMERMQFVTIHRTLE